MYFISGDCTRFLVRSVWVTGPWNYRCMLMYFPGGKEPAGISGATFLIEMSWRKVLLASERFGLHMVRYRALSVHLNFGTNLIICTHTAQNIFTYLYTTHGKWNIEKCCFGKDSSFKSGWTFGISSVAIPSSFFRPFQRDNAKPLRPGVFCQPFSYNLWCFPTQDDGTRGDPYRPLLAKFYWDGWVASQNTTGPFFRSMQQLRVDSCTVTVTPIFDKESQGWWFKYRFNKLKGCKTSCC